MTRRILLALLLFPAFALTASAHDVFLKLGDYFVKPRSRVTLQVLNGTFTSSETGIERARLAMLKLAANDTVIDLATSAWNPAEPSSSLAIQTGAEGTYVVGASLKPRERKLNGFEFNKYLIEEGLRDVVDERKRAGIDKRPAGERYSKHVKAIFQVGDSTSGDWKASLGFPAEIIPRDNPYELSEGDYLRIWCGVDGKPARGVVVIVGGRAAAGTPIFAMQYRTGANGVAKFPVPKAGTYYAKFVSMKPVRGGSVDYESRSATLTFAVRKTGRGAP